MNFTTNNNYYSLDEATHKPKISFVRDSIGICFKCSDGGATQFGDTAKEAYKALIKLRN